MKRTFVLLFLLIAAAFVALTLQRRAAQDGSPGASPAETAERTRIREFWSAYHDATALRTQGDFQAAAQRYEAALKLDPDHEETLYYLGNCLFEMGDYGLARTIYQRLTELNPHSQRAFGQLGIVASAPLPGAQPDFEAAERAFLRIAEINQEESGPFLRLGFLQLQRGRLEEAFQRFNTAAGFRSPEGLFMAGYVRFRQERRQEAAALFEKVLAIEEHEGRISGRGVTSEGDTAAGESSLTPLEAAALKARIFLFWLHPRKSGPHSVLAEEIARGAQRDRERVQGPLPTAGLKDWSRVGRTAAADFDGDGSLDLAATLLDGGLRLLQRSGRQFRDVSAALGLAGSEAIWDVAWGDADGDGDPDLYAVGSGWIGEEPNRLYRNDCRGGSECRFVPVTQEAGLQGRRNTARAFFLDFDGDGRLDLVEAGAGAPPLRLYRNTGGGRFQEVSARAGIQFEGTAVDVAPGDFNGDGRPDLFVLRWRRPGLLFVNQGNGLFQERSQAMGLQDVGGEGLSVLVLDYDRDSRLDLLLPAQAAWERSLRFLLQPKLKAVHQTARLFRNSENGRFEEVTEAAGLNRCWSVAQPISLDFDGDGWKDLVFANGGLEAYRLEPSVALRNDQGRGFSSYAAIPALDLPGNALGAGAYDLDGDGREEVLLAGAGWFRLK